MSIVKWFSCRPYPFLTNWNEESWPIPLVHISIQVKRLLYFSILSQSNLFLIFYKFTNSLKLTQDHGLEGVIHKTSCIFILMIRIQSYCRILLYQFLYYYIMRLDTQYKSILLLNYIVLLIFGIYPIILLSCVQFTHVHTYFYQ